MLPKIRELPKVKKELNEYKKLIKNQNNPILQKKAQLLYDELIEKLDLIDKGHSSEYDGNIDPEKLRDTIAESISIRRQLNKFLPKTKKNFNPKSK